MSVNKATDQKVFELSHFQTLTSDHYGMEFLEHGTLDLWGA